MIGWDFLAEKKKLFIFNKSVSQCLKKFLIFDKFVCMCICKN